MVSIDELELEEKTGSDVLLDNLVKSENIKILFGIPGGANLPIFDSIPKYKARLILMGHEQGAGHAAQGYARASGKVGVAIATSGPGATNLVTAIADAKMDSTPIVAITGQVSTKLMGTDAFQETDVVGVTRVITKHNYLVKDTDSLAQVVKDAFYIASTGRQGPVLIDIPKDVQQNKTIISYAKKNNTKNYNPIPKIDENQIDKAIDLIKKAKRPVLYVGGGVISANAHKELFEFATKCNIPVATTLMGLGAFPEDHYLALRWLGMHGAPAANFALNTSDVIIAFGVRFDDRVTGKVSEFAKESKIIHVDIDASELNKIKQAEVPIHGDVKSVLERFNSSLNEKEHSEWLKIIREREKQFPFPLPLGNDNGYIKPQYVMQELYNATEGKATFTTGVGQHQMWLPQYYKFKEPRKFISSLGLATMGYGLPAAIGVKLAKPNDLVINVDGDGSLNMTVQELSTIAREKIPVKTVVINNQHLGMVRQWQEDFYEENFSGVYLGKGGNIYPDFEKIANGYDVKSRRITRKEDIRNALEEMIREDGPYLLDIIVDPKEKVYPIVGPGKAWHEFVYSK